MRDSTDYGEIYFVIGGSASGKSEYAENLAAGLQCDGGLIYLATMSAGDDESLERIEKHKRNRAGKNFFTVERDKNISGAQVMKSDVVLLEDLSNLLANEMFSEGGDPDRIFSDICRLSRRCSKLVIVSNDIFSDSYEGADMYTREYISRLGELNRKIADIAKEATEVVCLIPLRMDKVD